MSRYIDAKWLEDNAKEYSLGYYEYDEWATPLNVLDSASSIDICFCRECKYAEVSVSPITGLWCTRFGINDMAMEDDDFCSHGQRKESER